jgi:hypothetical protein
LETGTDRRNDRNGRRAAGDGNPWVEAVVLVKAVRLKARQGADQLAVVIDSGGPRKANTLVQP